VGDGITERFQFLVGGLQLRRAFNNAFFQFRVEAAYFAFRVFAFRDVADVAWITSVADLYTLLTNSTAMWRPSLVPAAGLHSGHIRPFVIARA